MSTSLLYHAFGIRGYQYTRTDYVGGQTVFTIHQKPETCCCSACGSPEVQMRGCVERSGFGGRDFDSEVCALRRRPVLAASVGGAL